MALCELGSLCATFLERAWAFWPWRAWGGAGRGASQRGPGGRRRALEGRRRRGLLRRALSEDGREELEMGAEQAEPLAAQACEWHLDAAPDYTSMHIFPPSFSPPPLFRNIKSQVRVFLLSVLLLARRLGPDRGVGAYRPVGPATVLARDGERSVRVEGKDLLRVSVKSVLIGSSGLLVCLCVCVCVGVFS